MAANVTPPPSSPSPTQLAKFADPKTRVRPVQYSASAAPKAAVPTTTAPDSVARTENTPRFRPQRIHFVPRATPAPVDAVLTINPASPRPFSRPLHIDEDEIRTVDARTLACLTRELIIMTVAAPQDAWSSDDGASDHYLRQSWVVQVRRKDNHVIGVFPAAYALAVRPSDVEHDTMRDTSGRSNRKKQGTRHPASIPELKKRLDMHGFVVSRSGSTHGRITHPEFPGLFTPWASTPSDRRYPQLVTSQVKRVFGIDIRDAPHGQ